MAEVSPTDSATGHEVAVLAALPTVRDWQEDLYRDLHRHPELSHQEHRTAGLVAEKLRETGCEVHEASAAPAL